MKIINIGQLIRQRAKELRIGTGDLAEQANTTRQNIYGIYKRQSINTELLRKISKALQYNFFLHYINAETGDLLEEPSMKYRPAEWKSQVEEIRELQRKLRELEKEVSDLKEKYELQKKVNKLLEKKFSERG